jgi:lantibiotic modifying enzyme
VNNQTKNNKQLKDTAELILADYDDNDITVFQAIDRVEALPTQTKQETIQGNHEHELEYCQAPQDFTKRYGRWQVRCIECDYKSYLISDHPPTTQSNQTKNTRKLNRKAILKILHQTESCTGCKDHYKRPEKCDMDYAAPRCAKRVKQIEALLTQTKQETIQACKDVVDGLKTDIKSTRERMLRMGLSEESVNNQEIDWIDMNDQIDDISSALNKLGDK